MIEIRDERALTALTFAQELFSHLQLRTGGLGDAKKWTMGWKPNDLEEDSGVQSVELGSKLFGDGDVQTRGAGHDNHMNNLPCS